MCCKWPYYIQLSSSIKMNPSQEDMEQYLLALTQFCPVYVGLETGSNVSPVAQSPLLKLGFITRQSRKNKPHAYPVHLGVFQYNSVSIHCNTP